MFRRKSPEGRELRERLDEWRQPTLNVLAHPAMQDALGKERAQRLHRLGAQAGILIVGTEGQIDRAESQRSKNGLYFVPVTQGHGPDARIELAGDSYCIGHVTQNKLGGLFITHSEATGPTVLALPVDQVRAKPESARVAATVHELSHGLQLDDGERYIYSGDNLADDTRYEAQAYDGQYAAANYYYDGGLQPIVEATARRTDDAIESPNAVWTRRLQEDGAAANAIETAAAHLRCDYTPDGITSPPMSLVDWYAENERLNIAVDLD